jgi:hypothetical protein
MLAAAPSSRFTPPGKSAIEIPIQKATTVTRIPFKLAYFL